MKQHHFVSVEYPPPLPAPDSEDIVFEKADDGFSALKRG